MELKKLAGLLIIIFVFICQPSLTQPGYKGKKNFYQKSKEKIIVEVRLAPANAKDSVSLSFTAIEKTPGYWNTNDTRIKLKNGIVKWSIASRLPYIINTREFLTTQNTYWVTEPGDSVVISYSGGNLKFTGQGAEKFELQNRIKIIKDSLKRELSNPYDSHTKSLEDYLEWNSYLKKLFKFVLPLIDSYKSKISPFAFNYIRDVALDGIVDYRSDKFNSFRVYAKQSGKFSSQDILNIYDSTYAANTTGEKLPSMSRPFLGSWRPVMFQVFRKYSFDSESPPLNSKLSRHLLYLEQGLKIYKGFVREKFLEEFLTSQMIKEFGLVPEVESALAKYYAEPNYPEYKKYVKEYEKEHRTLIPGRPAPEFALTDAQDNPFSKKETKGKVVLLDFWFTGCQGCLSMTSAIRQVEERFKDDPDILFVSVSADENKSKWIKSLSEAKYTTGKGVNLYTDGQGDKHPIIKSYAVDAYPTLYLLDGAGNIVQNPLPDPRTDQGKKLIQLMEEQLALLKDGPYLMHEQGQRTAYNIDGRSVITQTFSAENPPELTVQTDKYLKTFPVRLKQQMIIEPSEFDQPQKLLAFSDIEGNFDAFRKLLQSNKVIDENYNWTFDKGHLVFCGDMFDRGNQVTECLWLLYSLEEKAKAAGGYVHFVLGNHEIMNLNSDHRYAEDKYIQNAALIGRSYAELYSSASELGKWLRTKNIMEKIGNMLFVHGGICKEVSELPLSISEMNTLARPYLDKDSLARQSTDKKLALLFNYEDKLSPFWYRDYYLDQEMKILGGGQKGIDTVYKTPMKVIDDVLEKFGVAHIITGHTVVAHNNEAGDTVSVHYNGKVLNTDTRHALGKSEALLIEGDKFYRVNDKGEKKLLFLATLGQEPALNRQTANH